jgi:putative effector of murein hydrolase
LDVILVRNNKESLTSNQMMDIYLAYTRISDFQHHWHDVLVGAIVGSLIAFVTFKFILNWRHYNPKFLPYTIAPVRTKPLSLYNGGVLANSSHGIRPATDYEQDHHF